MTCGGSMASTMISILMLLSGEGSLGGVSEFISGKGEMEICWIIIPA